MANTDEFVQMSTRDGESGEFPDDSFAALHNSSDQRTYPRAKSKIKKLILLYVILISLVGGIAINIVLIVQYKEHVYNENNQETSQFSPGAVRDNNPSCIYHTKQSFLDNLSDGLDVEFCTPRILTTVTIDGWAVCNKETSEYIRKECLCDNISQCQTSNFDRFQKQNCTACRNKDHCPCVFGTCLPCPGVTRVAEPECKCQDGAKGKFCNKVAQRLCTPVKSSMNKDLPFCNVTNEVACTHITENFTFNCNFPETLPRIQNCENYAATDFLGSDRNKDERSEDEKEKNQSLQKPFLIGSLALQLIALICLIIYIYKQQRNRGIPESRT